MARALDQADGLGRYCNEVLRQLLVLDPLTRYVIFLGSDRTASHWSEFQNARPHVLRSRSKLVWDQLLVPAAARALGVDLLFNRNSPSPC